MKGLDTNVLVRYLIRDDDGQAALAKHLIDSQCSGERPGFINRVVLCELIWVLETVYRYTRIQIAETLERIFRTRQLRVENSEVALAALHAYRLHSVGFADALIGAVNRLHGADKTATFDKNAARLEEFELLR